MMRREDKFDLAVGARAGGRFVPVNGIDQRHRRAVKRLRAGRAMSPGLSRGLADGRYSLWRLSQLRA